MVAVWAQGSLEFFHITLIAALIGSSSASLPSAITGSRPCRWPGRRRAHARRPRAGEARFSARKGMLWTTWTARGRAWCTT